MFVLNKKPEKFLFHLHNFDDGPEIEGENNEPLEEEGIEAAFVEPPPPSFSEEELEAAKQKAYQDGLAAGKDAAIEDQTHSLKNTLAALIAILPDFEAREAERNRLFEAETIHLASTIFHKLHPYYSKLYGLEELKAALNDVLSEQIGTLRDTIQISVPEAQVNPLKSYLDEAFPGHTYSLTAAPHAQENSYDIRWANGGALYSSSEIGTKIAEHLKLALDESGIIRNDQTEIPAMDDKCDIVKDEQNEPTPQADDAINPESEEEPTSSDEMEKPDE